MNTETYEDIQALARMTVGQLKDKYLEVFGEETRSCHREFLRKRIAWRVQAQPGPDNGGARIPARPRDHPRAQGEQAA